ncbi:TonB-dependent hemoglobin/transferrin/lactoferrin family receptor [Hansschlegelia sp. KR7-227]|uniref:TonB-dependent hemoglobin/transferrin/lactoferrin family receptor n=1 Tax=Hansschlegelia sp. KR7-227 TaxID=3400914 RepID=UPI003C103909
MNVRIGGQRRSVGVVALSACLAATGVIAPAAAEDGADEVIALDPLEVIGQIFAGWQGASDDVYDTPGAVAQIGREAIDERGGARNSGDLVRGVAGVNAVMDRQNPGMNVNIRGLQDQGRVNMSIDGARQNFQQSGHGATAFAYIDPELIGGVDIDKGPTSLAGGAGVIGGVVNFRTLNFDDIALPGRDYGVRFNGTTGTNAFTFNGSLAAASRVTESFELVGAVGRKKLGEYEVGKRGDLDYVGLGERAEYTTQDQWSWLLKATAEPAENHKLTLSYTGLSTKFGTGSGPYVDTDDVVNHTIVADWRWTPGSAWADVAAKLYYTRTSNDQFRPRRLRDPDGDPNDPGNIRYSEANVDYAIDTYGGSLSNTSRFAIPLFDVALTYGGEYFLDKTDTASVYADPADDPSGSQFTGSNPVGERGVGGLFARAELSHADWLKVLAGVRYDRYYMKGSGVVFDGLGSGCGSARCPSPFDVDVDGGRFSPTATIAVTPLTGLQLYTSYEQGYRPPNIMEAILGGEHIGGPLQAPFAPNPNLDPEISRTVEAGANVKLDGVLQDGDALRAKASIYSTWVDDFITQAAVRSGNDTMLQNVNLKDRTRLRGVDLEANYDAGYAYIGGSASFIDARYGDDYDNIPSFGPALAGIYLAPKRKLAVDGGARFFERRLTVGGRVTYVDPEDNIGSITGAYNYNTYTLIDLYTSFKVNDQITFRASVENIRDVAYVEAMGAALSPSPGRTFTIGATARF